MEIKFQPRQTEIRFEFSLFIYFLIVFFIYNLPYAIAPCILTHESFLFSKLYEKSFLPIIFILLSMLLTIVFRKHILLRAIIMIFLGVLLAIGQFAITPGIIDPVYYFILSATCAGILGFYKGRYLFEEAEKISVFNHITDKILDSVRDAYKYILGKAFQAWLGLGASLGVSMSILFRNGYTDIGLKFMALKMLLGFICISIAIGYWIALPTLNGIVFIHEKLSDFDIENNENIVTSNNRVEGTAKDRIN